MFCSRLDKNTVTYFEVHGVQVLLISFDPKNRENTKFDNKNGSERRHQAKYPLLN
jgi:hypothetical protein